MFGLFMLVGIVKKNGILQVDATNQLRAAGHSRNEAILVANHTRLRPILMTTVMLVAAMVPIALGNGPGAGARASMAKVIIGGQMLSLVLALVVTPVFLSAARHGREPAAQNLGFGSDRASPTAGDCTPSRHVQPTVNGASGRPRVPMPSKFWRETILIAARQSPGDAAFDNNRRDTVQDFTDADEWRS